MYRYIIYAVSCIVRKYVRVYVYRCVSFVYIHLLREGDAP